MQTIADFRVRIIKQDDGVVITLHSEGDEFDLELETTDDLVDEVDALLHEQLTKCGMA